MFAAAAHLVLCLGTIYNMSVGQFPDPRHFSAQSLQDAQSSILFVFLVLLYYLILACIHRRTGTTISKVQPTDLPHTKHQCLYCCVKSEGRVAEIRLCCLFLGQSVLLYLWSLMLWIHRDYHTAQQFIIVNEILILISWYHLMKISSLHSLLYLLNIAIFLFWGIYSTHVASGHVHPESI